MNSWNFSTTLNLIDLNTCTQQCYYLETWEDQVLQYELKHKSFHSCALLPSTTINVLTSTNCYSYNIHNDRKTGIDLIHTHTHTHIQVERMEESQYQFCKIFRFAVN